MKPSQVRQSDSHHSKQAPSKAAPPLQVEYGKVRDTAELGKLARAHRKHRKLTLTTLSGLGNLSTRFLSEFERGKETAELGKVLHALRLLGLDVVIQPRRLGTTGSAGVPALEEAAANPRPDDTLSPLPTTSPAPIQSNREPAPEDSRHD